MLYAFVLLSVYFLNIVSDSRTECLKVAFRSQRYLFQMEGSLFVQRRQLSFFTGEHTINLLYSLSSWRIQIKRLRRIRREPTFTTMPKVISLRLLRLFRLLEEEPWGSLLRVRSTTTVVCFHRFHWKTMAHLRWIGRRNTCSWQCCMTLLKSWSPEDASILPFRKH